MKKKQFEYFNLPKWAFWIIIILLFLSIIMPALLTRSSPFGLFDKYSSYVGDTIGGITAPFINLIAAILVYVTFKGQNKANDLTMEIKTFEMLKEELSGISHLLGHFKYNNSTDINAISEFINDYLLLLGMPSRNSKFKFEDIKSKIKEDKEISVNRESFYIIVRNYTFVIKTLVKVDLPDLYKEIIFLNHLDTLKFIREKLSNIKSISEPQIFTYLGFKDFDYCDEFEKNFIKLNDKYSISETH